MLEHGLLGAFVNFVQLVNVVLLHLAGGHQSLVHHPRDGELAWLGLGRLHIHRSVLELTVQSIGH